MIIVCAYCGREVERRTSDVNRARKFGRPLYCDQKCAGLKRRTGKTIEQRKAEIAEYGRRRREGMGDTLRAQKKAYYQANKRLIRKRLLKRFESDAEYKARHRACQDRCQSRPEWKARKKHYDRQYRAGRLYGPMAEAYVTLLELDDEIRKRVPDNAELAAEKGTLNKKQTRRREWEREN